LRIRLDFKHAIAVGAGLELDVIKIVANRLARIAYDMFGGG
jgi:glycerol dehydrogenase-like iron-containing ADH family enzyme